MDSKITSKKEYKSVVNHLISHAPNGVYMGELMNELKLDYKTANPIVHHLQSLGALSLDYSDIVHKVKLHNEVIPYFLIWPNSSKLLDIQNDTFWKKFFRDLFSPANIIAALSFVLSIISLIVALQPK